MNILNFRLFATVFALASDATTLAPVTTAMSTLVTVMGQVWEVMVANPLLVVFLAASLLSVGIKIFRKVKGAAKG